MVECAKVGRYFFDFGSGCLRAGPRCFPDEAGVFFLVKIRDKTKIATSLLAARFHDIGLVAIGTTLGMMLADVPASSWARRRQRSFP
jgi:putative Ca2+/H+ antiporter (TMEM165/GDT1 family)